MPFTLTPEQADAFERRGVLRLPAFYPAEPIARMAGSLWADLERRFGIKPDRPETWTVPAPAQFRSLKHSGAFDAMGTPELFALADALMGPGCWAAPSPWAGPLVTFPTAGPVIERPPWHLDIGGVERLDPLPTLRVFTFLEPSRPGGGGTLYVAGSHRLAMDIEREGGARVRSAYVRDRLEADHPWFARLLKAPYAELAALMNVEAEVGGRAVRLEEMTGEPGDLIVMHPALMHGGAHNALDRPRMMLTSWIPRKDAA